MLRSRTRLGWVALVVALSVGLTLGAGSFWRTTAQDDASASGLTVPFFGAIADDSGEVGTFQGTVSNLVASEGDGIALDGVLNGLAVIGDDAVRVVDQTFSTTVEPSVVGSIAAEEYEGASGDDQATDEEEATEEAGDDEEDATEEAGAVGAVRAYSMQTQDDPGKCDVLFLDIQPITLNLLGLEVLTSRITIDVNAIPGEGNLIGNLVCALAGLLDGTPDAIGEITDQLNQVLSGGTTGTTTETATAGAATEVAPDSTVVVPTTEPTEAAEPTVPSGTPTS